MTDYCDISNIETYLDSILKKKVSKNVYAGTLPSTLSEGVTDMVLIDVVNMRSTAELHVPNMGEATVNIFLYAAPTSKGRKNVALLSKMEKAFNDIMASPDNEHYTLTELYSQSGYDATYKLHYNIKAIHLTIS